MHLTQSLRHSPTHTNTNMQQDLGNYERFLHVRLTNDSNLTTGKVYQAGCRHTLMDGYTHTT